MHFSAQRIGGFVVFRVIQGFSLAGWWIGLGIRDIWMAYRLICYLYKIVLLLLPTQQGMGGGGIRKLQFSRGAKTNSKLQQHTNRIFE